MSYFEKDAIISGMGASRIGRRTGIPGLDLTMESVRAAIDDAGLAPGGQDGMAARGDAPAAEVNAALQIDAADCGTGFSTGGLLNPVMSACRAVSEGRARRGIIYRTIQMLGGTVPVKQDENAPVPPLARMFEAPPEAKKPVRSRPDRRDVNDLVAAQGYSAANWLALHCRRHMELYGTTKEQLGWLAVNSRRNAALNCRAVFRDPMTMANSYLGARPVSTPFGLLDCDIPIDGSIAVVVSSANYAGDCPHLAVKVEAVGGSNRAGGWFHRADYPKMASADAAAQMWSRTDLTPAT